MLFWDAVIFLKTLKMCYVTLKLKSQLIEKSEHFILKFWRKPFNFSGKKKTPLFSAETVHWLQQDSEMGSMSFYGF